MGGVCSVKAMRKNDESNVKVGDEVNASSGFSGKLKSTGSFGKKNKNEDDPYPSSYPDMELFGNRPNHMYDSGELGISISRELKPSMPARTGDNKAPHAGSFLGKAGIAGLEKAVDVIDTLGSSMSSLNSGGFVSGVASRGNKISILAFEVANTIVKGANLFQSLSEENVQFLKKEIFHSEAVRQLVSTDMKELLSIAASDKREEFNVFSREVVRFGNRCKDPQWHNLDRYFSKLDLDTVSSKQSRKEAVATIEQLTSLAQNTSELYHEFHALDRFEQDYRRKIDELESLNLPRKGESLSMLHSELKHQRKVVKSLQKKSLWSKSLEEVVEKLFDVVTFIHQEISEAFGDKDVIFTGKDSSKKPQRLGEAGLALHYANIITQIDNIATRPTSLPPNIRDALYHGLPPSVKTALRTRLLALNDNEKLTVPQIKSVMEKTLQWLVPVATDTTKAHQGFGWVGEWANTGNDFGKNSATQSSLIRLQTLYHADKKKMDMYILNLLTLLHRMINLVRFRDKALPTRSPTRKGLLLREDTVIGNGKLSAEDRNLLEEVIKRKKLVPGISKSQEFVIKKKKAETEVWALSKSTGSSPRRNMEYAKANFLDVLDGLDTSF